MGFFDFMKDAGDRILGRDGDKPDDVTKPLSTHLRENGIDPSGIDFKFQGGGTVVLSGTVKSQDDREKAVLVVGNVQGVERVEDRLRVAREGADFGGVSGGANQPMLKDPDRIYPGQVLRIPQ